MKINQASNHGLAPGDPHQIPASTGREQGKEQRQHPQRNTGIALAASAANVTARRSGALLPSGN